LPNLRPPKSEISNRTACGWILHNKGPTFQPRAKAPPNPRQHGHRRGQHPQPAPPRAEPRQLRGLGHGQHADALADLQNKAEGNLRLGLSGGGIPKLEATDAIPSNVQKAVDGFNGFTTNLTSSLDDVGQVSKDISHLVNATSKMPANLMQEFSKSSNGTIGLIEKLFILPKAIKNTTHNVKVVAGLDDRVSLLNHRIQDLVGTVQNSFDGPKTGKGKGNGGGNGKRKGKGKRGR